ncbi:YqcI/YcgG family protein [Halomonas campisalis]|uniref:YqcI/YcgG family protein n=1 Tax=Billgrantia campisalis TaxID=74661 RepID=A0ABS9P6Z8_9GAMM|nr:YqcI/YcgG family protein [Halomonas campisalis]MCG6657543.1 YqcI/YcgG family protein [Halomonas campisalis]MDR5862685.1 YqcI/YcgG family protein [Halomonas campisalis]
MSISQISRTELGIEDNHSVPEKFHTGTWQRDAFDSFKSTMTSEDHPFPCIFGVHGLKHNHLRYIFHEAIDIKKLAKQLRAYLKHSRSYGNNTSLVLFTNTDKRLELDHYFTAFWNTLKALAETDDQPWPRDIPVDISHKNWEFCFAGEPIFVVCNTPSHVLRYSRHSHHYMITFQPRWVFDNILGTPAQAKKAFSKVRSILQKYDVTPISPDLGVYGQEGVLESRQYFLDDVNKPKECPFKSLKGLS